MPTDNVDYSSVQLQMVIDVDRATPSVTVNPVKIGVGTPLNNKQLSGTATFVVNGLSVTVTGKFSYTHDDGSVLPAGKHAESVTFTPDDLTDYHAVTIDIIVTVSK